MSARALIVCCTAWCVQALLGQPVLTNFQSYIPGAEYGYWRSAYIDPPMSGESEAYWDYTGWISGVGPSDHWTYSEPYPNLFPPATVSDGAPAYGHFFQATDSSFVEWGYLGVDYGVNCSDPMTWMTYPFTWGTQFTDSFVCAVTNSGQLYQRDSAWITVHGSSYGTLVLDYGTFTDVLLVDINYGFVDVYTLNPDVRYPYQVNAQFFIKPGIRPPLVKNFKETMAGAGPGWSDILKPAYLGTEDLERMDGGFRLYPDPADAFVNVDLKDAVGPVRVGVYDARGQLVLRTTIPNGMDHRLNIQRLPPGTYAVHVSDGGGMNAVRNLVVY